MAYIEKRGKGFRLSTYLGKDENGKKIFERTTWVPDEGMSAQKAEKEAKRQAVLFEEAVKKAMMAPGSDMTVSELYPIYREKHSKKKNKIKTYERNDGLMKRINDAIGHIPINKLKPEHLNQFYDNLTEPGIRGNQRCVSKVNAKALMKELRLTQEKLAEMAGVSISVVRSFANGRRIYLSSAEKIEKAIGRTDLFENIDKDRRLEDKTQLEYHRLLSSMLNMAVKWDLIPVNPCKKADKPRYCQKEANYYDPEEVNMLLLELEKQPLQHQVAIQTALYTGIRRGELAGIKWSKVNTRSGVIDIVCEVINTKEFGRIEDTPKTEKSVRKVSVPDDVIEKMLELRESYREKGLPCGDDDYIMQAKRGGSINPDILTSWFRNFVDSVDDTPNYSLKSMRHTAATLLLQDDGVNEADVSAVMGHSTPTTTMKYYAHAKKRMYAKSGNIVKKVLEEASDKEDDTTI